MLTFRIRRLSDPRQTVEIHGQDQGQTEPGFYTSSFVIDGQPMQNIVECRLKNGYAVMKARIAADTEFLAAHDLDWYRVEVVS